MKAVTLARLVYKRFVQKDDEAALYLLNKVGKTLIPGYRFVFPQLAWWFDAPFNAFLRRFDELEGMNSDRKWMVRQLCRLARRVDGDTAECGVFRGASSYLICAANRGTGKVHHAFDSFEGLSRPGPRDGDYWTAGTLACDLDSVKAALREFDAVAYHKGWIPDRFADVADRRFSFVHVDVDLEQPTRDSIAFFYPRMNSGGVFVCDDYGFTSCPGATLAVDDYLADKPEKMIGLSGGGGFFIKGAAVADAAAPGAP
jgi:hypothetical protein